MLTAVNCDAPVKTSNERAQVLAMLRPLAVANTPNDTPKTPTAKPRVMLAVTGSGGRGEASGNFAEEVEHGRVHLGGVGEVGRVRRALDAHEVAAVAETGRQFLGPLHRDRVVGGAVHDEGGTHDVAEPVGDVVSRQEAA